METQEIWKDIPGHNYFQGSNLGRIRNKNRLGCKSLGIRNPVLNKSGRLQVSTHINGKYKLLSVHRLICIAFKGLPIGEKNQVNHINGNPEDNSINNLEWCTPKENIQHAFRTGLRVVPSGINSWMYGTKSSRRKPVIQLCKSTLLFLCRYNSITEAGKKLGISSGHISACCKGKKKSIGGFKWKYEI